MSLGDESWFTINERCDVISSVQLRSAAGGQVSEHSPAERLQHLAASLAWAAGCIHLVNLAKFFLKETTT